MGLDGYQAYQFRRVEAGVEVLRVALDQVPSSATEHLIADLQKDLLLLGVMLPASSPPKPAEPEGPVCDAGVPGGGSAPHEDAFQQFYADLKEGYSPEALARASYFAGIVAPRKVWAVQWSMEGESGDMTKAMFVSRQLAERYISAVDAKGIDYSITEYEVADA